MLVHMGAGMPPSFSGYGTQHTESALGLRENGKKMVIADVNSCLQSFLDSF